jgi:hypothetical protein
VNGAPAFMAGVPFFLVLLSRSDPVSMQADATKRCQPTFDGGGLLSELEMAGYCTVHGLAEPPLHANRDQTSPGSSVSHVIRGCSSQQLSNLLNSKEWFVQASYPRANICASSLGPSGHSALIVAEASFAGLML